MKWQRSKLLPDNLCKWVLYICFSYENLIRKGYIKRNVGFNLLQ